MKESGSTASMKETASINSLMETLIKENLKMAKPMVTEFTMVLQDLYTKESG